MGSSLRHWPFGMLAIGLVGAGRGGLSEDQSAFVRGTHPGCMATDCGLLPYHTCTRLRSNALARDTSTLHALARCMHECTNVRVSMGNGVCPWQQAVDHPYLVVHSATAPGAKAAASLPPQAAAALPEGLGGPPGASPGGSSSGDIVCSICADPPEVRAHAPE